MEVNRAEWHYNHKGQHARNDLGTKKYDERQKSLSTFSGLTEGLIYISYK